MNKRPVVKKIWWLRGSLILAMLLAVITVLPGFVHAEPSLVPGMRQLEPFEPLHFYHGGKLVLSLLLAGTSVTDPEASNSERLMVGGSSILLGLPAAAVIYHSRRGNSTATRRWQLAAFTVDLALAGSLAGYGTYLIVDGTPSDQWTGLTALSTGILGILISQLDLIPFRDEKNGYAR